MGPFDFPIEIADAAVYERAVGTVREAGVLLPSFAQLADASSIPESMLARLTAVDPDAPDPANLFRVHWYNDPARVGRGEVPGYLDLPQSLTGVGARIIVALGERFPMIGAHKVLAAYACLAPRIVTGCFDPAGQRAVWPSTGNYCRGGVAISRVLGFRGVAVLPEGMSAELCSYCHRPPETLRGSAFARKPMQQGLTNFRDIEKRHFYTWDFVKRLKDTTVMMVVLKGIVTREDAELAVEHGADGIVVSNHGGRATESLRATIDCLPEVAAGVAGRIPILLDGGIRRGADIFKALALGADAVAIGRPYVWGLAAYGQDGVEKVIDILHRELFLLMAQMGARSIEEIRRGGWIVDRRTGERL